MSLRMGSEGFEPSPGGLKIRSAAVTPRPHHNCFANLQVAQGGVEPPLPPYQNDVLPLHYRAIADFLLKLRRQDSNLQQAP